MSEPTPAAVRRRQFWMMVGMAVLFLPPAIYGFGGKLYELFRLTGGDPDGAFAITPIVNYLLATLGFICLFAWATLHGMFADVEQPKRQLLEREARLDEEYPELAPLRCTSGFPTRHRNEAHQARR